MHDRSHFFSPFHFFQIIFCVVVMTTSMTDYLKVGFGIFYMISAIYGNGLSIETKRVRSWLEGGSTDCTKYSLAKGQPSIIAGSKALTRETESVSQSHLFFQSSLGQPWPLSRLKKLEKSNWGCHKCSLSLVGALLLASGCV